jgi:hypothetical protein
MLLQGRRVVENTGEIVAAIRERYPSAKVSLFTFGKDVQMTVVQQVRSGGRMSNGMIQDGSDGGDTCACI